MAFYTTELRTIVEHYGNNNKTGNYQDIDKAIETALPYIFGNFEVFDDNYRKVLETKIIKHFYTREIAFETVPLWKFKLNTKLEEIMPLYNQLYKSELIKFEPLYDVDMYTDHKGKRDTDSKETKENQDNENSKRELNRATDRSINDNRAVNGTDSSTSSSVDNATANDKTNATSSNQSNSQTTNDNRVGQVGRDLYSDTPQGSLDGVESQKYLTNARKTTQDTHTVDGGSTSAQESNDSTTTNESSSNSTSNNKNDRATATQETSNRNENSYDTSEDAYNLMRAGSSTALGTARTTDEYIQHVYGKTGGKNSSELLLDFRKTFLNIDMMVIEELEPLFFGLYE